jgi:lipoprotein NlpD
LRNVALVTLLIFALVIAGCSSYPAPVSSLDQPPSIRIMTHQVAAGDTLYSIAWRYDLNVQRLAATNGIGQPYEINLGQILSLDTAKARPSATKSARKTPTAVAKATVATPNPRKAAVKQKPIIYSANLNWQWPVKGKQIKQYDSKAVRKGVILEAVSGSAVRPAAPGTVVYAGDGLRGYGKLVIIKHSEILLSAYGYNEKIMVKEGQSVKTTEIISKLGSKGTLYFEIRKDGYPVNPSAYIE